MSPSEQRSTGQSLIRFLAFGVVLFGSAVAGAVLGAVLTGEASTLGTVCPFLTLQLSVAFVLRPLTLLLHPVTPDERLSFVPWLLPALTTPLGAAIGGLLTFWPVAAPTWVCVAAFAALGLTSGLLGAPTLRGAPMYWISDSREE